MKLHLEEYIATRGDSNLLRECRPPIKVRLRAEFRIYPDTMTAGISGTGHPGSYEGKSDSLGKYGSAGQYLGPSSESLSAKERIEEMVRDVDNSLRCYDGLRPEFEDYLFEAHTQCFVDYFAGHDIRGLKDVWANELEPLAKAREIEIGKPIHKGAPLHNTGLLFFADGDFDSALAYLAEAGKEDERAGRRKWHDSLTGNHPLTKHVLIEPLERDLFPNWTTDYLLITGRPLDSAEVTDLLTSLADRPTDAVQAVTELHRIRRSLTAPQNGGSSASRFRALADLVHLVESCLRLFQSSVTGQLHAHLSELLVHNNTAGASFGRFKGDFDSRWTKPTRDSVPAQNWVTSETRVRLSAARGHATACGIAAFFCLRLRNSLLHVNEEALDLFQTPALCVEATGWVLATLRICTLHKAGQFSRLV